MTSAPAAIRRGDPALRHLPAADHDDLARPPGAGRRDRRALVGAAAWDRHRPPRATRPVPGQVSQPTPGLGTDMTSTAPSAPIPTSCCPTCRRSTSAATTSSHGQPLKDEQVAAEGNTSPHLAWSGAPDGTRSFVVSCFDPDARRRLGFWHWTVVDIPAGVEELPAGAGAGATTLPWQRVHVRNDTGTRRLQRRRTARGRPGHRYYFVVYAVDTDSLGVGPDATPPWWAFNLVFHTLGRAIVQGHVPALTGPRPGSRILRASSTPAIS